jgi:hypothetical protein
MEMVDAERELVQGSWNIRVDFVDEAALALCEFVTRAAVTVEVEETGLAEFDGDVEEVFVFFVVEVADYVRVEVAFLEEFDFLLGEAEVLW